jgi:hypothetical protein
VRTPALVGVAVGPEAFAALFAAARETGLRLGWLELAAAPAAPVPAELERAAALGALRAVAAGGGRSVAVKPVGGAPVVRDLLREHFLGCTVVLVRGLDGWPRLEPDGEEFRLWTAAERGRRMDAAQLVAELARPRHRVARRAP